MLAITRKKILEQISSDYDIAIFLAKRKTSFFDIVKYHAENIYIGQKILGFNLFSGPANIEIPELILLEVSIINIQTRLFKQERRSIYIKCEAHK